MKPQHALIAMATCLVAAACTAGPPSTPAPTTPTTSPSVVGRVGLAQAATYTSEEQQFSVSVPAGWYIEEPGGDLAVGTLMLPTQRGTVTLWSPRALGAVDPYLNSLWIGSAPLSGDMTLADWHDGQFGATQEHCGPSTGTATANVAGHPISGALFTCSGTTYLNLAFIVGDRAYHIGYGDYPAAWDVGQGILDTFNSTAGSVWVTAVEPTPTTPPPTVVASVCEGVASDAFVRVLGRANIFGAGHDEPPAPGEGGAGVLPPEVEVDISEGALVTFPCTSGKVDCCAGSSNSDRAGPAGGAGWHTDIESYGGISGIVHAERGVFLVGVFLGDEEPADPAPERLDFTATCPAACTFGTLEPELGQIFYIGDGGEQSTYVAPAGATRLFLGIADAFFVKGLPGWYGNNAGEFQAAVTVQ